jgi:hypothetical protein
LTFTVVPKEGHTTFITSNKILPKLNTLSSNFLGGFSAWGRGFLKLEPQETTFYRWVSDTPILILPATRLGSFVSGQSTLLRYFVGTILTAFLLLTLRLPESFSSKNFTTGACSCGGTPGTCCDFTVRRRGVWNNLQKTPLTGGLIESSALSFSLSACTGCGSF